MSDGITSEADPLSSSFAAVRKLFSAIKCVFSGGLAVGTVAESDRPVVRVVISAEKKRRHDPKFLFVVFRVLNGHIADRSGLDRGSALEEDVISRAFVFELAEVDVGRGIVGGVGV